MRFCGTSRMARASAASRRSVLWFGVLIRRDELASPGCEMHVEETAHVLGTASGGGNL
jgi:hypothetical protein